MKKYFAWFFFVSGVIGLFKMLMALIDGAPKNVGAVELWSSWLALFFINALCFYLWNKWK
jgi:hypothetical protein